MGRRGEVHTGFWCGDLRGKPLGRPKCKREYGMSSRSGLGHGLD